MYRGPQIKKFANCGFGAEIVARVTENVFEYLEKPPIRIALPDIPSPTTNALSKHFYKDFRHILDAVGKACDKKVNIPVIQRSESENYDVPDENFTGPF